MKASIVLPAGVKYIHWDTEDRGKTLSVKLQNDHVQSSARRNFAYRNLLCRVAHLRHRQTDHEEDEKKNSTGGAEARPEPHRSWWKLPAVESRQVVGTRARRKGKGKGALFLILGRQIFSTANAVVSGRKGFGNISVLQQPCTTTSCKRPTQGRCSWALSRGYRRPSQLPGCGSRW